MAWRQLLSATFAFSLTLIPMSLPKAAVPSVARVLIVGTTQQGNTPASILFKLIVTEAMRRAGVSGIFMIFPLQRLTVELEQGKIDIEMGRVAAYGAAHPTLVRVDESIASIRFSAYTANSNVRADNLQYLLSRTDWRGEYRRGF